MGVSRSGVETHRAETAERSKTYKMENKEVVEFMAGPVSAFMEDDKDDEDLLRIIKDLENVIQ